MKIVLQILCGLALVGTVLPSILFLMGSIDLPAVKSVMLVSTVVWFACSIAIGFIKPSELKPSESDGAPSTMPSP